MSSAINVPARPPEGVDQRFDEGFDLGGGVVGDVTGVFEGNGVAVAVEVEVNGDRSAGW